MNKIVNKSIQSIILSNNSICAKLINKQNHNFISFLSRAVHSFNSYSLNVIIRLNKSE